MTNIAVASPKHRRLKRGVYIALAHESGRYECMNAHCWVISSEEEKILLQKRGPKEGCFPNCYDISLAGHIDEGEDSKTAIIREAYEEGRINIAPYLSSKPRKYYFTEKGIFNNEVFIHNQQAFVYTVAMKNKTINKIMAGSEEVGGFELVLFSEFKELVKTKNLKLVQHPVSYYSQVIKDITNLFNCIAATK